MTAIPKTHEYLLDAQVATLATVGPDGRPQVSEVWFLAEDGSVLTARRRNADAGQRAVGVTTHRARRVLRDLTADRAEHPAGERAEST